MKNIVAKHDYYIELLEINLSENEALEKEKEYISKFGRKQFGSGGTLVNLTDGGEGVIGRIFSEEEKKILSEKAKNNPEQLTSGRRKEFFGLHLFGEDNPNFGNKGEDNPLSIKTVKLSLKGELIQIYDSLSECAIDNDTTISAVSAVCQNKRHQLKGFIYRYLKDYEKNDLKITTGKTSKKTVLQIDLHTNEVIRTFSSCSETKEFGFNPNNVSQVCRGSKKTHMGYKWKYEE